MLFIGQYRFCFKIGHAESFEEKVEEAQENFWNRSPQLCSSNKSLLNELIPNLFKVVPVALLVAFLSYMGQIIQQCGLGVGGNSGGDWNIQHWESTYDNWLGTQKQGWSWHLITFDYLVDFSP